MEYVPDDLTRRECYKVLTSFVLPRPIAWVTSVGPSGVVNAAPFSFFNVFCEDPPLCMFAVNRRPDGREKDTLVNIQRSGEFVVHLTDEALAQRKPSPLVVPANSGNPYRVISQEKLDGRHLPPNLSLGLWVPAFAGTTPRRGRESTCSRA